MVQKLASGRVKVGVGVGARASLYFICLFVVYEVGVELGGA